MSVGVNLKQFDLMDSQNAIIQHAILFKVFLLLLLFFTGKVPSKVSLVYCESQRGVSYIKNSSDLMNFRIFSLSNL